MDRSIHHNVVEEAGSILGTGKFNTTSSTLTFVTSDVSTRWLLPYLNITAPLAWSNMVISKSVTDDLLLVSKMYLDFAPAGRMLFDMMHFVRQEQG